MEIFGWPLRPKVFWRDFRVAWKALFAKDDDEIWTARRALLLHNINDPDLQTAVQRLISAMPQARIDDDAVTVDARDWRVHFAGRLEGRGLEIGALNRPIPVHARMHVEYVDRFSADELRRRHVELEDDPVDATILSDAETLTGVPDGRYDFVIAAHVLEHMLDPIGALLAWCRVMRRGGLLYLVLPDKRVTFDQPRVRTTIEHMVIDHLRPSAERDFEHYLDYAVHVQRSSGLPAIAEADRLLREQFSIHYHVFLPSDLVGLIAWIAEHHRPVRVVEGPACAPNDNEFHLLVEAT